MRNKRKTYLESKEYPGYYLIPHYEGYLISLKGELLREMDGFKLNWHITKSNISKNIKGGYYVTNVTISRKRKGISRHRALALAFKEDDDYENKIINHKNGIPGDDRLENLEWVTYSENLIHALKMGLMPNSVKSVIVRNVITNDIQKFISVAECSRYFKYSESFVCERIEKRFDVNYLDNLQFKYDDGSEWKELSDKFLSGKHGASYTPILAKNISTGQIFVFESIVLASSFTKVYAGHISKELNSNKKIPMHGYIFNKLSKNVVWPEFTERELAIYNYSPRNNSGVLVYDKNGNEVNFFDSCQSAANFFKISLSSFYKILNKTRYHSVQDIYDFQIYNVYR